MQRNWSTSDRLIVLRDLIVVEGPQEEGQVRLRQELVRIRDEGFVPDILLVTGSSELLTFMTPENREIFETFYSLYPKVPVVVVALACLGLHGCLMEVERRNLGSALIMLIEYPSDLQQFGLNVLGARAERLQAVGCGSLLLLERECQSYRPKSTNLVIGGFQIISPRSGFLGLASVASKLVSYLHGTRPLLEDRTVSFALPVEYSTRLLRILNRACNGNIAPQRWLDSSEECGCHRLTIKPLFELQRYRNEVAGVLTILSLGGGGRIGCIQVGQRSQAKRFVRPTRGCAVKVDLHPAAFLASSVLHRLAKDPDNFDTADEFRSVMCYLKQNGEMEKGSYYIYEVGCSLSNFQSLLALRAGSA